ncbi:F0F1 ATP synthase subunit A [Wansuia hejianensis]|uniref:F0F1 ATP synthase subunit A n=1 Tax=Wansuia hejianensis TaxID=2763667 RepID=UPI0020162F38
MEIFITLGDKEIFIPDSIVNFVFIALFIVIFSAIVNKKAKNTNPDDVPSGFLNVVEMLIETINNLVRSTMGEHNMKFAPYILTIFVLILCSNLYGLLGFTSPTSDYSVTLALALATFVIVQVTGVRSAGGLFKYLKGFTEPNFLLTPLNVIGELANPVSLSFRLFGNILSGGLIMTLLYALFGYLAPVLAPPFHIYFDIFSGGLQAFIFTMLTMVFIGGATEA